MSRNTRFDEVAEFLEVTSREGRVSRNQHLKNHFGANIVTSREGRVSRNVKIYNTIIL